MIIKMKEEYFVWKKNLEIEIRRLKRVKAKRRVLTPEEELEEEDEVFRYCQQFFNDNKRDEKFFEIIHCSKIPSFDLLVNALHVDVLLTLTRCQLSDGKNKMLRKLDKKNTIMKDMKSEVELIKEQGNLQGIADAKIKRTNIMNQAYSKQIREDKKVLDLDLTKAGILETQKPQLTEYESRIMIEANANPYFNAIVYMALALNKKKTQDQDYLLNESFHYIEVCEKIEKESVEIGIRNSQEVLATMFDNKLTRETAQKVYPFATMYDEELHKEAKIPRSPILISKSSTKFVFKLPFFKPKIPELLVLENPNRAIISSMAIYGKKANNTDVSATSTELSNTGIRYQTNDIVSIPHLVPNEKYCFAVAAFDAEENICNDIGTSGEDIYAALPLPINLLYNY
jgi:hypothetical protein